MILDPSTLHPTYRAVVGPALDAMLSSYPACPLKEVRVYRGVPSDRSLGNADEPGVISLNAYWFADRDYEALREEARQGYLFVLPGCAEVLKWHGGMTEPMHLLAHEFGHVLSDVLPGYVEFAEAGWQAATADPPTAVSGYACSGPHEWWGEAFAAAWMQLDHPSARAVREFLA